MEIRDYLTYHETLVAGIDQIYICWLGNNPLENMGPDAVVVVDELFHGTLELSRKHPCCPKWSLLFTLHLTTMWVQVIKLSFCFKPISKEFKI